MYFWIFVILFGVGFIALIVSSIVNSNVNKDIRKSENSNTIEWLKEYKYSPSVDFSYESIMHDIKVRFMADENRKTIITIHISNSYIVI
jgi:hypothetical protein